MGKNNLTKFEEKFLVVFLIFLIFIILIDFSHFFNKYIYLPDFLNLKFKLGLDLAGGTILTYSADLSNIKDEDKKETMEILKEVIERRVNLFGINEPKVTYSIVENTGRLYVELPGIKSPQEAIEKIGETPYLEFYIPQTSTSSTSTINFVPSGLNGKYLKKAQVEYVSGLIEPVVSLSFNEEGAKIFKELTQKYLGQPIAIVLDGKIISSPVVREVIENGNAQISGKFSFKEAQQLARRLNEGTLPVKMEIVGQQTISGSYGKDFVSLILKASFFAFLTIAIFMILYYRFGGLISSLALLVYAILNIFIYKAFGIVLTLAGIVGFILSIGMAIDANILILERMKEEKREVKVVLF
jgi:preprotein translocase subunit SecD